jgi:hypothetical protein
MVRHGWSGMLQVLIVDMDFHEVIGVIDMEKRMRYGQVDRHGWEEKTEDSVWATKEGVEV